MSDTVGMKLEYEVSAADFSSAGEASSNIKKVLRQLGIDNGLIRRVAICTYEAEINIAIHSLGGQIIVNICSDRIEIIAQDRGPGIADIELAMKSGYSTASSAVRELGFGAGMGLPNMKKCCDVFYIDSKVNEFTYVKMILNL